MKIVVELSQVKIWKFGFLRLTLFAETWCEMWDHVFKESTSAVQLHPSSSSGAHDEPPGQDPVVVGAVPAAAPLRRPAGRRGGGGRGAGQGLRGVQGEAPGTNCIK